MKTEASALGTPRTYTVILEPADEGGLVVRVPALAEIVTEGDTQEEALAMAQDAIEPFSGVGTNGANSFPIEAVLWGQTRRV